jgi:predicted anti-sigma-YlaC factor YlaD
MLNCQEATRLLSDRLEHPLSRRQRMALVVHTMMCNACRNFGKQAEFLRQVAARFADSDLPKRSRK